jgi:Ca2+/H+ antiporter/uncharacterized membrane protein YccF (DUF307 family)
MEDRTEGEGDLSSSSSSDSPTDASLISGGEGELVIRLDVPKRNKSFTSLHQQETSDHSDVEQQQDAKSSSMEYRKSRRRSIDDAHANTRRSSRRHRRSIDAIRRRRSSKRKEGDKDDESSSSSDDDSDERKASEGMNVLFGIRPMRLPMSTGRPEKNPVPPPKALAAPPKKSVSLFTLGNVLWVLLFGWELALVYTFVAVFMYLTFIGRPYARICWKLKSYYFWPFGKYIIQKQGLPQDYGSEGSDNVDYGFLSKQGLKRIAKDLWHSAYVYLADVSTSAALKGNFTTSSSSSSDGSSHHRLYTGIYTKDSAHARGAQRGRAPTSSTSGQSNTDLTLSVPGDDDGGEGETQSLIRSGNNKNSNNNNNTNNNNKNGGDDMVEAGLKGGDEHDTLPELGSLVGTRRISYSGLLIYFFWILTGGLLVNLVHCLVFIVCWMSIVLIPMAKVNQVALWLNLRRPLDIDVVVQPNSAGQILLCTYQATNYNYYRYSVQGLNVVLVNLLPFVGLTLILGYLVPHDQRPHPIVICVTALLSISPIAYYIGMAVASIAAQTTFAIGAMLTAIFGVSIEIILYSIAINKGDLITLVQAGVVGSLLGDLLLLPGLSMIFGGIKYKEQKFSPAAAGVSSVLLIVSIIGIFTPTFYWLINGETRLVCTACTSNSTVTCEECYSEPVDFKHNQEFLDNARPLMWAVAGILPFAYLVGLLFTLKTHAHIFKNMADEGGEGGGEHDAPNWSKTKSVIILACSIVLFALVAEELVKSIEPTIEAIGIEQTFAGVTVMALVPSSAEYVNAISFALSNNVALSLEIGAASAVQISLIMMPILVVVSAIVSESQPILIFPMFNAFAVIFSVIIVNYISIEGMANYFKGAALVVVYCLFIVGFYFHH